MDKHKEVEDINEVLMAVRSLQQDEHPAYNTVKSLLQDNIVLNQELVKARKRIKKLETTILGGHNNVKTNN